MNAGTARATRTGWQARKHPLIARIVCCCDAYNAMTTDRPYRPALPAEEARAELLAHRGSQFDPTVVDALQATLCRPREPVE
jgi:HD-GYP domain-containing protein (c-di-GMP phosphodiesterase class II)